MVMPAIAPPMDVTLPESEGLDSTFKPENSGRSLRDVVTELTRAQPGVMLAFAFAAGALWMRLRK